MNRARTPVKVKSIPGPRVQAGRRVKAARFMAGGISARETATEAGLSYMHLVAVEAGREPLLDTDARDLGALLGCPPGWLLGGWGADGERG